MQSYMEETLMWMLVGTSTKTWDEGENRKRIDFVHSLGQKCDSVGWSELILSAPQADDILQRIEDFCRENGWSARGYYSRRYTEKDCQWYRLCGEAWKDSEVSDSPETLESQSGEKLSLEQLKAYAIMGKGPKESSRGQQCVSEHFLNAYLESGLDGLRFCWLRDVGKYEGTQYFAIAPEKRIPNMMCDAGLSYVVQNLQKLKSRPIYQTLLQLGGKLPRLAEIFCDLRILLENCYLRKDMPDACFAYGYWEQPKRGLRQNDILIRADAAEMLLKKKALSKNQISPVYIAEEAIPGYPMLETAEIPFPTAEVLSSRMELYSSLSSTFRPRRIVTEKDALKILRLAKKQRAEDFSKAMPKKQRDLLTGTPYETMMPYYAICAGGYLSDEFRLLNYKKSIELTKEFADNMSKEETTRIVADGIVIAACPDGDLLLMTPKKAVLRISHEIPEIIGQWSSLEMFIAEETT